MNRCTGVLCNRVMMKALVQAGGLLYVQRYIFSRLCHLRAIPIKSIGSLTRSRHGTARHRTAWCRTAAPDPDGS